MNTINELLQQLNTMQSDHIKTLEQRIEVINEHKQHLNETISNQANQLAEYIKIADSNYEEMQKIYNDNDKIKLSNLTKDAIIKKLLAKE
tara:strand:+ start:116 stop:385 length:270 start_codon:yes stop_codon:yes gene_type:complete